nr:hypothetical protein Iba_chr12aCG10070 [Ipomoea batatas]
MDVSLGEMRLGSAVRAAAFDEPNASMKPPILSYEVFDEMPRRVEGELNSGLHGGRRNGALVETGQMQGGEKGHRYTPVVVDERKSSTIAAALLARNRGSHVSIAVLSIVVASSWSCC